MQESLFEMRTEGFFTKAPQDIPYQDMKDSYLGSDYELSLVFCSKKTMRKLNRETRQKDYATNILFI